MLQSKTIIPRRGEYNVYSTFQSHEPEFDYLKSLEIEEKINKIRWLKRKNPAHFLLSTNDKTIKLWKVSERDKRVEGYNTKEENGAIRDPACITALRVSILKKAVLYNGKKLFVFKFFDLDNNECIMNVINNAWNVNVSGTHYKAHGADG